ncbi:hypothetical protein PHISCL_04315 [Aspergillus sclerotialis]|uniref:Uncharacterized protein n=1 Tax=Aspergillus sclerotialis TaxID=2070753 RepID=A0A3A2ZJB3_9EURO|nr:hypothetical protein PHISCL_04315 [Aspergillus sclerotialis]
MTSIQIPTVTIEDLQAFQAEHFPSQTQHTPTFQDAYDETEFAEDGDDDLGYYPDGVKRTLTDEQIRIFRHSEIHSLLRERQVRAENKAFDESESTGDENKDDDIGAERENDDFDQKAEVSEDSALKRESTTAQTNVNSTAAPLDYDDDGFAQNDHQPKTASGSFTGRRIISYAD